MRRSVLARAAILALLLLFGLPLSMTPARAAGEDVITNMDVRFEVRDNGTVGVSYRLDYRFAETGRRGILFSIIRKEPYGDGVHDARYDIANLAVDSPSGAPDQFEQTVERAGDTESVSLRIGDPDKPLSTREASYVITYEMAGALETHDGYAELFRDVTTDYPQIERYAVTVTAPGGVTEADCAAGSSDCATAIDGGNARYTGVNLRKGIALTVAAKLDASRIADAHPQLELQPIDTPRTLDIHATTTLHPDGVVTVQQTTRYRFPANGGEVRYAIPTRRPFSDAEDQLIEVSDVVVTDDTGTRLALREGLRGDGTSTQSRLISVDAPAARSAEGIGTLTLSYAARRALRPDKDNADRAQLRWPLVHEEAARFTEVTAEYRAPGEVLGLGCEIGATREGCGLPAADIAEGAGTFRIARELRMQPDPDREQVLVTVAAASVGNPQPVLGESIDRRETRRMGGSFLASVGLIVALIVGSLRLSRGQAFPGLRYAGVPPGVINPGGPLSDDGKIEQPVRFQPPDADLATAGLILDGRYRDRHTTAELVDSAVRGVTRIQMKPFTLWPGPRQDLPREWTSWFDPAVKSVVAEPGNHAPTTAAELTGLVEAVQQRQSAGTELLRSKDDLRGLKRARGFKALAAFGVLVAVVIGLRFALIPVFGAWVNGLAFFGIVAAAIACLIWRKRVGTAPLSATGTALRDQIVGFRTYLTTAEAHQLKFEAGQDIYSRYLPWAVLFDIADKWTATCQRLVEQGRLTPLRAGWIDQPVGRLGFLTADIGSELGRSVTATKAAAAAAALSSGGSSGSDGSSAFSGGGFSSGGGGGGTSSSSW